MIYYILSSLFLIICKIVQAAELPPHLNCNITFFLQIKSRPNGLLLNIIRNVVKKSMDLIYDPKFWEVNNAPCFTYKLNNMTIDVTLKILPVKRRIIGLLL